MQNQSGCDDAQLVGSESSAGGTQDQSSFVEAGREPVNSDTSGQLQNCDEDIATLLQSMEATPSAFMQLPESLRNDRSFFLRALEVNVSVFKYGSEHLLSDPEVRASVVYSGNDSMGGQQTGVFAVACQCIVSRRDRTGNRTVTHRRHPLLLEARPIVRDNRLPVYRRPLASRRKAY